MSAVIATPRTDAATCEGWSGDAQATDPEVARQLERELAVAETAILVLALYNHEAALKLKEMLAEMRGGK